MSKKKKQVAIIVRLHPGVHKAAKSMAEKKFMSLNGLINSALEKEVKTDPKINLVVSA